MTADLERLLADYPLATLLQTIPTGLFLVDDQQRIVYWNAEAERITGYPATAAIGRHCGFLEGEPCKGRCDLFADHIRKPHIGLSCSFRHKDGTLLNLNKNVDLLRNKSGQVIGGIEAFVDISRLKKLETDLRAAVEERTSELQREQAGLRAVLDGMVDPAYICDRKYQVVYVNRAMREISGDISGKQCYQAIYQRAEVCDDCPLERTLGGQIVRQEKTLNGTGRMYEVVHTPYPVADKPTHKLCVCRDMTERIEAQQRLAQTNRELDAFVSTVAHDLRSPLTPLLGFAELLGELYGDRLDELGRDCIAEIKKTTEKMKALTDDLLALARVGQVEMPEQPVAASMVVREVLLELADKILEHGAEIQIDSLPDICLPEALLADLFRNLLENGLKYAADTAPLIRVSGKLLGNRVRFQVIDHGPGIEPDERQKIFEPFQRGRSSVGLQGTGIGLATVAKIVRVCGGTIQIGETPGGGATFTIDLPQLQCGPESCSAMPDT